MILADAVFAHVCGVSPLITRAKYSAKIKRGVCDRDAVTEKPVVPNQVDSNLNIYTVFE
jgi:hypothetical protein